jgi:hypothetical protein
MLCLRLLLAGILIAQTQGFQLAVPLGLRKIDDKQRMSAAVSRTSAVLMSSIEVDAKSTGAVQSTRRTMLGQAAIAVLAILATPSKQAHAEQLVSVNEEIEGSDGSISKVGFTYPKSWKYERDVRISDIPMQAT